MGRVRLRGLGLTIGSLPTGKFNAITDVAGVTVGYFTLIRDMPHVVRTGITAIWPRGPETWTDYSFAGAFSFNGNGEMTGLSLDCGARPARCADPASRIRIRSASCATRSARSRCVTMLHKSSPPGRCRDLRRMAERHSELSTRDGHALPLSTRRPAAGRSPRATSVVERGMVCHEFKGGTGTASRVVMEGARYTVGALVQANYGLREQLRIDGVPVGREIGPQIVPAHYSEAGGPAER